MRNFITFLHLLLFIALLVVASIGGIAFRSFTFSKQCLIDEQKVSLSSGSTSQIDELFRELLSPGNTLEFYMLIKVISTIGIWFCVVELVYFYLVESKKQKK